MKEFKYSWCWDCNAPTIDLGEEDNTLAVMDELEAQIEKEEESLKLFQTEIDRRQELGLVLQSQSELEQAGQMQLFL